MKFLRKLLTPALLLTSLFGSAAAAQETAALPEAPSATLKIPAPTYNYRDAHADFGYQVPAPPSSSNGPLGDGFIGKIAGYVDRHSNDSQWPFDFAMGYKVKDRFTILAGTTVDMRTNSGKYEADRQAMRIMTGMSDWETRNIRDTLAGGMPDRNRHGGDGFAIGVRIQLGPKQ